MTIVPFYFKQANRFLLHITLVGLGIGTANYIINGDLNWIQWIIQSVSTSFLIGYPLVVIMLNRSWFKFYFKTKEKLYLSLSIAFILIGVAASEIEHVIRSLVFHSHPFQPLSAGKMYLFNGIISLILGHSFFQNDLSRNNSTTPTEDETNSQSQKDKTGEFLDSADPIIKVPVKQGENILLIPIHDVIYFEAYDNYSFVYDAKGEKKLCDYSLLFLEKRLSKSFSRVHRKYIVNETHIKQISPHLNSRYLIQFDTGLAPITSSKGYSSAIRKLIKIE
ncbi:MAG: LytTR family transcriptional regulator DNA-binding domain-containing protein [Cyclobacteriaceae bacterium]